MCAGLHAPLHQCTQPFAPRGVLCVQQFPSSTRQRPPYHRVRPHTEGTWGGGYSAQVLAYAMGAVLATKAHAHMHARRTSLHVHVCVCVCMPRANLCVCVRVIAVPACARHGVCRCWSRCAQHAGDRKAGRGKACNEAVLCPARTLCRQRGHFCVQFIVPFDLALLDQDDTRGPLGLPRCPQVLLGWDVHVRHVGILAHDRYMCNDVDR